MALTRDLELQIIRQAYKDHAEGKPRLLPRKAPQPADAPAPATPFEHADGHADGGEQPGNVGAVP